MNRHIIKILIGKSHAKKLIGGSLFQMKHHDIVHGHADHIPCELHLSEHELKRLHKNLDKGLGHRFHNIIGGAINWKKQMHTIAPIARALAHKVIDAKSKQDVVNAVKDAIDNKVGGKLKIDMHALKSIGKSIIHPLVSTGIGAVATALTDNPAIGAVASQALSKPVNNYIDKQIGSGAKHAKFRKGSEEAKEHMRKLREKRKHKHGGSLIPPGPN